EIRALVRRTAISAWCPTCAAGVGARSPQLRAPADGPHAERPAALSAPRALSGRPPGLIPRHPSTAAVAAITPSAPPPRPHAARASFCRAALRRDSSNLEGQERPSLSAR